MNRYNLDERIFESKHLDEIQLLGDEDDVIKGNAQLLHDLAWKGHVASFGGPRQYCGTALLDGRPFCIGGYIELAPGVAQIFLIPDKRIFEKPAAFLWMAKTALKWMESQEWCERIQTPTLPVDRLERFLERMGFGCEAVLKRYTSGRDYKLWARVKEDGVWRSV
jgi:hypothetical protein